jgi:hypothetical protein
MIRKTLILFISAILLISTLGLTVTIHYCGNTLVSFNINGKVKSCCGETCKSCHNKSLQFKISNSYNKPAISNYYLSYNLINFGLSEVKPLLVNDNSYLKLYPDLSSPPLYKISNSYLKIFRL